MALVKALHTVHQTVDGETKVRTPGEIFDVENDATLSFLRRKQAVVNPTADEVTLWKLAHGAAPAPVTTEAKVPTGSGETDGKASEDNIG